MQAIGKCRVCDTPVIVVGELADYHVCCEKCLFAVKYAEKYVITFREETSRLRDELRKLKYERK